MRTIRAVLKLAGLVVLIVPLAPVWLLGFTFGLVRCAWASGWTQAERL